MSLIRPHIEEMSFDLRQISDLASTIPGCIRADIGSLNYPLPPEIYDIMSSVSRSETFPYTSTLGDPKFVDALFHFESEQTAHYNNPEFLVTSGGQAGLFSICMARLNSGAGILTDHVYYPPYKGIADVLQAPLYSIDFDQMEEEFKEMSSIQLLIINHPHNPTGKSYTSQQLDVLAGYAERHNWLVIEDRVYDRIYFDRKPDSLASRIPHRTISLHSASKNLCAPGMRIGWMIGEKQLIDQIAKVHRNMNSSPNSYAQHVLSEYLLKAGPFFKSLRNEMNQRKALTLQLLDNLQWPCEDPTGGIYVFPKVVGQTNTRDLVFDLIKEAGVSFIPGDCFGNGNEAHLRICYGALRQDSIEELGQRLRTYFGK